MNVTSEPELPKAHAEILIDDLEGQAASAAHLRAGDLVGLPTETVYGLAADATNGKAVAGIYEAKGRPSFNPLIVHVASMAAAERLVVFNDTARALADAFWPGPLTLVLPLRPTSGVASILTAGLDTLAVRVPAHPSMQAVLQAFGGPIAAPSANRSGRISATKAAHVFADLGDRIAAVLDAGPTAVGLESTILAPGASGTRILRDGGLAREVIEPVAGPLISDVTPGRVEAPGQMTSHYAPRLPLRQGGGGPQSGEIRIGFGDVQGDLTLSAAGDLTEAAARLFATLHEADALGQSKGATGIWVADVPDVGLGRAINDRLARAAVRP